MDILDEAVCIVCRANTLRKGMHPTILSLAEKIVEQTGLFNLGIANSQGEKIIEFKPVKLH